MTGQHRLEAHARHFPDPRGVVAAGADQVLAVGAEGTLVGQVIMVHAMDRQTGAGVPQDDLVVVAGGGHELCCMGGNAADGAYVFHRKILFSSENNQSLMEWLDLATFDSR
ncbi:hypothetical protein D3C76_1380080 [compost metagenome]